MIIKLFTNQELETLVDALSWITMTRISPVAKDNSDFEGGKKENFAGIS
jgi:hypothetical protein